MKNKKEDQRVRLTKELLKNALVDLMQKQHISKITIKSICELADINRSTFYVHYNDQYDLLNQIQAELMGNLTGYLERHENIDIPSISNQSLIRLLDYIKDNQKIFRALFSDHSDKTFHKEIIRLAHLVSAKQNQAFEPRIQEYFEAFSIAGSISILQKWLNGGAAESTEFLAGFIIDIVYQGITAFTGDKK